MLLIINSIISLIIGWTFYEAISSKSFDLSNQRLFRPNSKLDITARTLTGSSLWVISSYALLTIHNSDSTIASSLMIMSLVYALSIPLLYFARNDAEEMTVPLVPVVIYTTLLILVNMSLLIFFGTRSWFQIWENLTFVPIQNLVSGAFLAIGVGLIIMLTKGRGMGRADIFFAAILGLLNGYGRSVVGVYIAIFSALIYGLFVSIPDRTIRNKRIPFIPFLVLGTIAAIMLGDSALESVMACIRDLLY